MAKELLQFLTGSVMPELPSRPPTASSGKGSAQGLQAWHCTWLSLLLCKVTVLLRRSSQLVGGYAVTFMLCQVWSQAYFFLSKNFLPLRFANYLNVAVAVHCLVHAVSELHMHQSYIARRLLKWLLYLSFVIILLVFTSQVHIKLLTYTDIHTFNACPCKKICRIDFFFLKSPQLSLLTDINSVTPSQDDGLFMV